MAELACAFAFFAYQLAVVKPVLLMLAPVAGPTLYARAACDFVPDLFENPSAVETGNHVENNFLKVEITYL